MADETPNAASAPGSASGRGSLPAILPARDPTAAEGKNRRRHERNEFAAKVSLHELDGDLPGGAQIAEAVDLSRSGIGLRTRRMFYVGTPVIIVIEQRSQRTFKCGIVRFSKYVSDGWHHCGVEFTIVPATDKLQMWIQRRCG